MFEVNVVDLNVEVNVEVKDVFRFVAKKQLGVAKRQFVSFDI